LELLCDDTFLRPSPELAKIYFFTAETGCAPISATSDRAIAVFNRGFAAFASVFMAFAVNTPELFAFVGACRRVQSLADESDTSIDDNNI
jgi:hypothetical protein